MTKYLGGIREVQLTGRNARKPYTRIVLNMQGQSIAAGASLSQDIDLSGYDKAIFATIFNATTFTGTISLVNMIGNLWAGTAQSTIPSASISASTPTGSALFQPIAEKQRVSLTNSSASSVTITTAEVIAQ